MKGTPCIHVFKLLFLIVVIWSVVFAEDSKSATADDATKKGQDESMSGETGDIKGKIMPFDVYKKLFAKQRSFQLDAVKTIMTFDKYEYKFTLIDKMLIKMFETLGQGKLNLTEWGYIPGDEFTHNATLKEAVSKVLENTALFGDLVLRLPDIVHSLYDKNREWHILMGWAVMFSLESKVFEGSSGELLNLMSQEIGLIERSDEYINPYKESEIQKALKDAEFEKDKKKKAKAIKKKKEKRKGPRLSGAGHTEL